jgi:hypothetical protein
VVRLKKFLLLRELNAEYTVSTTPWIACVDKARLQLYLKDWTWINIGSKLSEAMLGVPEKERSYIVMEQLRTLVSDAPGTKLVLDQIDILFFPDFQLDVLKLLTQLDRNKRVIAIWPGSYQANKLRYSEPEYADYHEYDLQQYDVLCITG